MANYEFEYYINAPEVRGGSGAIKHATAARYNVVGEDNWRDIRRKDIVLPAQEVIDELATGTNPQKIAKYKTLLVKHLFYTDEAITGWSIAELTQQLENQELEALAATAISDFVTVTLGKTFPVKVPI